MAEPSQPDSMGMWILGLLVTAISAITGTVVALGKRLEAVYLGQIADLKSSVAELKADQNKCEQDRRELFERVTKLEEKHG